MWFVDADAPDGRAAWSSSRASTATSTTSSTTRAPRRRPVLRRHQRRRRRELRARRSTPVGDARTRRTGRPSSPTATTSGSTTSTRSPTTSCCRERADGLERLRVLDLGDDGASPTTTCSRCPSRCTRVVARRQPRVRRRTTLRYGYTSLVAPVTDVRLRPRRRATRTLVKRQPVLGGYDPEQYDVGATVGDRARRHPGPDLDRAPARRAARRHRARCCSTATARTRSRSTRRSRASRLSACSTAASCSRSRTCAAAASWAGAGTRTASSLHKTQHVHRLRRVRRAPGRARATRRPTGSPRAAAAPAGC